MLIRANGANMKKATEIFVGIDISKAWLDVAMHEQTEVFRCSNDAPGIRSLVQRLKKLKPVLIVLEPTGGFEMLVVAELTHAGLAAVVVNAKRVRDFARATGRLAKNRQVGRQGLSPFCGSRTTSSAQLEECRRRATDCLVDPPQAGFRHVDRGKEPFGDRTS